MKHLILIFVTALCATAMISQTSNAAITLLLNSKTITGVADGAALNTWTGDVGSATAVNAPTYQASSGINGLAGVRFDAIDDGMDTSLTQSTGAYTVMTVYNFNGGGSAFRRVLNGGVGASTQNWLIGPYANTHRHYAGGWVANPGPSAVTTPLVLATAINTGIGTGASTFLVNGTDETDSAVPTGGFGQLGLGTSGQFGETADSDIGLVLVFDTALTSDERIGVESIIASNFNLTGFSATSSQLALGNGLLAGTSLVPEPSSMAILALACLGITIGARRRHR